MQGGAGRRVRRRRCGSVTESPGPALAASPGSGVLYPSFRSASFLARRRWGRPGRQPLSCNWTRHEWVQRGIFVELLVLLIAQRRLEQLLPYSIPNGAPLDSDFYYRGWRAGFRHSSSVPINLVFICTNTCTCRVLEAADPG